MGKGKSSTQICLGWRYMLVHGRVVLDLSEARSGNRGVECHEVYFQIFSNWLSQPTFPKYWFANGRRHDVCVCNIPCVVFEDKESRFVLYTVSNGKPKQKWLCGSGLSVRPIIKKAKSRKIAMGSGGTNHSFHNQFRGISESEKNKYLQGVCCGLDMQRIRAVMPKPFDWYMIIMFAMIFAILNEAFPWSFLWRMSTSN